MQRIDVRWLVTKVVCTSTQKLQVYVLHRCLYCLLSWWVTCWGICLCRSFDKYYGCHAYSYAASLVCLQGAVFLKHDEEDQLHVCTHLQMQHTDIQYVWMVAEWILLNRETIPTFIFSHYLKLTETIEKNSLWCPASTHILFTIQAWQLPYSLALLIFIC